MSTVNNKGKNTLENLSMLMALFLRICAGVGDGGDFGGAHNNKEFSLGVSKMLFVALGFLGG